LSLSSRVEGPQNNNNNDKSNDNKSAPLDPKDKDIKTLRNVGTLSPKRHSETHQTIWNSNNNNNIAE